MWEYTNAITEYYDNEWNFLNSTVDTFFYDAAGNYNGSITWNTAPNPGPLRREKDVYDANGLNIFNSYEYFTDGHWKLENGFKTDSIINPDGSKELIDSFYRSNILGWLPDQKSIYYLGSDKKPKGIARYFFSNTNWVLNDSFGNISWKIYKPNSIFWADYLPYNGTNAYSRYFFDSTIKAWHMVEDVRHTFYGDSILASEVFKYLYSYPDSQVQSTTFYTDGTEKEERELNYQNGKVAGYSEKEFFNKYDKDGDLLEVICGDSIFKNIFQKEYRIEYTYEDPPVFNQPPPHIIQYYYKIYPNPVIDILHVIIPDDELAGGTTIKVYDLSGRTLAASKFSSQTQDIDVSTLPAGLYILALENASQIERKKIVKVNR